MSLEVRLILKIDFMGKILCTNKFYSNILEKYTNNIICFYYVHI